jgi:N-hydroxyarylamine O-acetyltransferase
MTSATVETTETVDRYLARLGLAARPAPTAEALADLQRRHLDAVPYENLAIMLGRPDATDPERTLARIAAGGNAGYCFHHNGAFEVALRALGYAVQRRFGHVWTTQEARATPLLNHLVLLVTIDGRRWWPDLGLGDAFRDPVELVTGPVSQGSFRYEVCEILGDGWSFRHDPAGSFAGVDVSAHAPAPDEVAAAHRRLSTPPDGRFTRVLVAQRRDDAGIEWVRGIRHQRVGDGAFGRDLHGYADWRATLASLGVSLSGVAEQELLGLHARMRAAHAEWLATGEA